jgi:hypothetical protein
MPVPGLIDTYAFADWMKVQYAKAGRPVMVVTPEAGGLLTVSFGKPAVTRQFADQINDELAEKYPFFQKRKEERDAAKQRNVEANRQQEYQDGDQSGQTAEAGSSNRAVGGVSQSEAQAGTSPVKYCGMCDEGSRDSGGVQPWGEAIFVACPCVMPQYRPFPAVPPAPPKGLIKC